jgi:spermidine synthase
MIVLVLEVLGSRVLGPYFGISLFIWTSLITITLLSLSIGYAVGGLLSDRHQNRDLFYILILAAGISVFFIPMIQKPISLAMTSLGPRLGCLVTAFFLFAFPLTLLGMVAPFSLKLSLKELKLAGKISGNLYALSTLGGILGTLLVGFWLIPNLGLKKIFFLISMMLAILSGVYFLTRKSWLGLGLAGLTIGTNLLFIFYLSDQKSPAEIIYKSESYYGQLKVLERQKTRMLMVDGAIQTAYSFEDHLSKAPYTALIEEAMNAFRDQPGKKRLRGLIIGLGGGIIPEAGYRRGDQIDIVEIDPRVPRVAGDYFEFHPEHFQLFLEDARHFLNINRTKYDYIVLDVFAGESAPFYLLSLECFKQIRESLADDGLLIMNTIGIFAGEGSEFTRSIYKTLQPVFPYRAALNTSVQENFSNYIMLASSRPVTQLVASSPRMIEHEVHLSNDGGILLSDDQNPADFLEQKVALSWRLAIWRGISSEILLD